MLLVMLLVMLVVSLQLEEEQEPLCSHSQARDSGMEQLLIISWSWELLNDYNTQDYINHLLD